MPTDMKTSVSKWGNSLGVRIPKPFADEAGLTPGEIIDMILKGGNIVLIKPKYTLGELIDSITPENLHGEDDFGQPMGNEIW